MNLPNTAHDERFPWHLTQARIKLLAEILFWAETVSRGRAADQTGCLLTDLREQCCQHAGAADPCPYMPLSPRFEDEE